MKKTDPQMKIRLSPQAKAWIESEARREMRSQTAQIEMCVQAAMRQQSEPAAGQASQA